MMLSRRQLLGFLWRQCSTNSSALTAAVLLGCWSKGRSKDLSKSAQIPTLKQKSGHFLNEIQAIQNRAIPKNSYRYKPPTPNELKRFQQLAKAVLDQDLALAIALAQLLQCELLQFRDIATQQQFYCIQEAGAASVQRGWGTYFLNLNPQSNALIEVPHILFDRGSEEIGANIFLRSAAHSFLIAGAHRHANGPNSADVCDPINSIFDIVHQAWVSPTRSTWQIHSFNRISKPGFPLDTEAVLSDGKGTFSAQVIDLAQRLRQQQIVAYVYNQLPPQSSLNQRLNGGISGSVFRPLAALHNVQGKYCQQIASPFTHIELEQKQRSRRRERELVADIIADTIKAARIPN